MVPQPQINDVTSWSRSSVASFNNPRRKGMIGNPLPLIVIINTPQAKPWWNVLEHNGSVRCLIPWAFLGASTGTLIGTQSKSPGASMRIRLKPLTLNTARAYYRNLPGLLRIVNIVTHSWDSNSPTSIQELASQVLTETALIP